MDPISAGIAGIASLAGGIISNESTDERLQKQMDFQREMRDTAYQATMADMKKAGLNPILAYQRGPTSSPTGAFASATDVLTPAVNSAMQAGRVHQEVQNMVTAQENIKADTNLKVANMRQSLANADLADQNTKNAAVQTAILVSEATKGKIDTQLLEKYPWLRTLGTVGHELGRTFSPVGAIAPGVNSAAGVARTFQERWP